MKLPSVKFSMKLNFSIIINLLLALVIILEVYFTYTLLYTNLNPEPTDIVFNKIVRVDLKSYQEISDSILNLESYQPKAVDIGNSNPFKYGN